MGQVICGLAIVGHTGRHIAMKGDKNPGKRGNAGDPS